MNDLYFIILLQIILILLNAFFSCVEIAIISMNDNKLSKLVSNNNHKAIKLSKLIEKPTKFLSTIQVAITLSGFLGSAFAAENFSDILVNTILKTNSQLPLNVIHSFSVILITIILSYFTLVLGELVPKQIGLRKAEMIALNSASILSVIATIFTPIIWLLTSSTNLILKLFKIDPNQEEIQDSEEEIKMMIDVGSEKGTIDIEEKEFIQNIFEFDDLIAEDILTHRREVIMLDIQDSIEKWHQTIISHPYTLYPIFDDSIDKIIGVLNSKKYFRLQHHNKETIMKEAVQKAYFVLDTINADVLFKNMKKEKQNIAIVLDEYKGVRGIITIHDLIEQLVGNLEENEIMIKKIEENTWQLHGSALIEEISNELKINLPEQFDTFNGLIFHTLENVPQKGNDIHIEIYGLEIDIQNINDYQIETAIVRKKE